LLLVSFTIQEQSVDDVVVLKISGRITLGRNCQQVEWKVEDLLGGEKTKIVLDLSDVDHLDSSGVGIIMMCYGKAKKSGGELRLAGVTGNVERTLKAVNLERIFQFYPTAAAAVQAFSISGSQSRA
jgi:anti-sigma B factor antagonist